MSESLLLRHGTCPSLRRGDTDNPPTAGKPTLFPETTTD